MRWTYKPEPSLIKVNSLAKALGIHTTIAKILVQRGVETFEEAKAFFRPNLADLHDPFLMKDMEKAVERIEKALKNKENILVYGDYDVDGTTSVALVSKYLKTKQDAIGTYVPDRETEGYGISFKSIDFADDNGFSLVIALDCGIKAMDKIAYATTKGIDFIICDHHTPSDKLPDAVAVLDPKRKDCNYPYKELSGCGVGFKLIQALQQRQGKDVTTLVPYLDLVATSIAADIVPITGENRVLCYHGLQVINENPSLGIEGLKTTFDKKILTITDVVFGIAPRINAAGRLKHAHFAVDLLVEQDIDKAREKASSLNEVNNQRKELDEKITQEALAQIADAAKKDSFTTVVYNESWHKGVIGIVASRLIETHYRPTVVFTKNGDFLTASARSVRGFDIYKALHACDSYIEQWGGHKYAAGLSIKPENFKAFKTAFEKVVRNTIKPEYRQRETLVDSDLFLSDVNLKFHRILEQMAPFGPGNMHPVFAASDLRDNGLGKRVGADKSHLKLNILEGTNPKTYSGIAFSLGKLFPLIQKPFKIIFTIDKNHWNGNTSVQLKIKDIKEQNKDTKVS